MDELKKLQEENKKIKEALEEIADYDVAQRHDYVDEWTEAASFTACQNIAQNALNNLKKRG